MQGFLHDLEEDANNPMDPQKLDEYVQAMVGTVNLRTNRYVMRCAIWCYLYNLKNVKNTHEGVLLLVKLQAEAYNFTKINTPP